MKRQILTIVIFFTILSSLVNAATHFPNRTDFRDESIYFVMTTRFYDGDESNNVQCWDGQQYNQGDPAWRGDFKGLIEKLDYIKALGFTTIWITPVVENASGYDYHGYHASNMSAVDHRYESDDIGFQELINAVHEKGMKLVLDIVLNHTGNFGEANLCKLFERDWNADQSDINSCMVPFTQKDGGKLPDNYLDLPSGEQYWHRLRQMKNHDGQNHDNNNLWHHFGNFNWDNETRWWAQIAGDCVDLNTENPRTYNYLLECYINFIKMGVDGFRIDTGGHIPRLVFNKVFAPKFNEAAETYKSARNNGPFFMFTEVCARYTQIWYREQPALSVPFYTWKESKEYSWDDNESSWDNLVIYENSAFSHTNQLSCLSHYKDNGSSSINSQPTSNNVFLDGNNYHKPDYSKYSGISVIDFPMHHNFKNISSAWDIAISGDKYYNDASYNVVYVDSHDYAPNGAPEDQRFAQGTDTWAENLSLMFTFRGIPCLYYGSEIEFKKGCTIDKGPNMPLKDSGRAYFGGYIKGDINVTDFAEYNNTTGNINATLNYPLALHIQRLNKIRMAIPALRKGQYSTSGCSGKYAFKRRYTDAETDSYALVTISGNSTFSNIENGTYIDAITGDKKEVTNNTLTATCSGRGNMRIYVLSTDKTPAPGKIGNDGKYLYTSSPVNISQPSYDGTQEELSENEGLGGSEPGTIIPPVIENDEQCVFFERPNHWGSTIYTYVYYRDNSNNVHEICGPWPGKKCTSLGNNIYKYSFPEGTEKIGNGGTWYILFNDGSGNQTAGDPGFLCEQAAYYTINGKDHIVTETTFINNLVLNNLDIYTNGRNLHIYTSKPCNINIYGIDGRIVQSINLTEGLNVINGLESGIYIINRKKIFIK